MMTGRVASARGTSRLQLHHCSWQRQVVSRLCSGFCKAAFLKPPLSLLILVHTCTKKLYQNKTTAACMYRWRQRLSMLEYRNADFSCIIFMSTMWLHLSKKMGDKRLFRLFSSVFFLLEEYIKNSEGQCKQQWEVVPVGHPPSPWY